MYNTFFTNCYITDCGVTHAAVDPRARRPPFFVRTDKQAPIATFRAPAAAQGTPGLLSEQTSKRPRSKDFKPITTLPTAVLRVAAAALDALGNFCQNRQASSYPQVVHSLWLVIHRLRQNKEAAHWISKGFGPCFFERGPRTLVPGPYGFCF